MVAFYGVTLTLPLIYSRMYRCTTVVLGSITLYVVDNIIDEFVPRV